MEPVRVAFDVGPLAGPRTGVGNAAAAMLDHLRSRPEQITLLPYLTSWRAPRSSGPKLPFPAALAHRLWARCDMPRADRHLPPFDVIHGTNYVVPPSRMPRLVSVYDCWFLSEPTLATKPVRRAGEVMSRAIGHGAHVHTTAQATADQLHEMFGPSVAITVIPLGPLPLLAPPAQAPLPDLAGRRFVLALGTLERRKNLPRLVEAFARLSDADHDVLLVLAGADGDDRARIEATIDDHPHVASRVVLAGRVDEESRRWLIHHAAVFAYPSLDEGFGLPLLDAMQAGIPIVASTRGSIPEVVGDAALLADADDVPTLAGCLSTALGDIEARGRLQAAGHERYASFSWDNTTTQLIDLYCALARSA